MYRTLILYISIPLLLILLVAFGFLALESNGNKLQSRPARDVSQNAYQFRITGLDFTSHTGAGIEARIKADEIKINPRKFKIFNIQNVNELTITNANLEVYQHPDVEDKSPFFFSENIGGSVYKNISSDSENIGGSVYENISSDKEFGIISRGVINKLVIKMFDGQKPLLVITAASATIDFQNDEVTMHKAKVAHIPSRKYISGTTILWDDKNKSFKIPGKYFAKTPKGTIRDKKIQFDVNFVFSPLT